MIFPFGQRGGSGSSEETPGYRAKRGRGADERQRATEQEVGGKGPLRNERKRVVAVQEGGGWRETHEKEIPAMVKGDKQSNPISYRPGCSRCLSIPLVVL